MNSENCIFKRKISQSFISIYIITIVLLFILYAQWDCSYLKSVFNTNFRGKPRVLKIRNYHQNLIPVIINSTHELDINVSVQHIYWYARGRLGNLMFQYAAIYAAAMDAGKIPALIVREGKLKNKRLSNFFQISHPELPGPINNSRNRSRLKVYNVTLAWDKTLLSRVTNESYNAFSGFPNSYKYFVHRKMDILQEFRFIPKIQVNANAFLKNITKAERLASNVKSKEPISFVGVHVRRTDMIKWTSKHKAKFSGLAYLNKAMAWYRNYFIKPGKAPQKYVFVICSDDLVWCRATLNTSSDVVFCRGRSPVEDLAILANCNYSIITQGTYGWWAAFIASGRVTIYPTNYYQSDSSQIVDKGFTYETKYPTDWVGLPID